MTAVEWLVHEYFGGIENCTPDFRYHIEQAKEMEKEQIFETTNSGRILFLQNPVLEKLKNTNK